MSPAILERSGIGRREILEKAGVTVKLELSGVGENVQDHVYSGVTSYRRNPQAGTKARLSAVSYEMMPGFTSFDQMRDPDFAKAQAELEYALVHLLESSFV